MVKVAGTHRAARLFDEAPHLIVVGSDYLLVVAEVGALAWPQLESKAHALEAGGRAELAPVAHEHRCGHVLIGDVALVGLVDVTARRLARWRWRLVVELDARRYAVGELEAGVAVGSDLIEDRLPLACTGLGLGLGSGCRVGVRVSISSSHWPAASRPCQ